MKLEKLKDFALILQALTTEDSITASDLKSKLTHIGYPGILKTLKSWADSGYVEEIKLHKKELMLGGPKLKYRITKKAEEFQQGLVNILHHPEHIDLSTTVKKDNKANRLEKQELINELLVNIYEDLKEAFVSFLEQDHPEKTIDIFISQIQNIIKRDLETKI